MDWRRIQIFAKICGNKSFTAAAQIIGKSQSTLSRDVIQLEKKIGFKNLSGYDTKRLYAYLAERYLSFWFKKYTTYKEHPWIFIQN